jgi:hypothetical protein
MLTPGRGHEGPGREPTISRDAILIRNCGPFFCQKETTRQCVTRRTADCNEGRSRDRDSYGDVQDDYRVLVINADLERI